MKAAEKDLRTTDPELFGLIEKERQREHDAVRMIASENYASRAVMEATGSCLTNKYSEGYPGKRYYEGQVVIDVVERLASDRIKSLFGAEHANVQPYSGSPANLAVYLAFCQAGDPIMGLSLDAGGHLTHGHGVSITGKYFNSIPYGVRKSDHRIDVDQVAKLAREHRPKLIWCGTTAYPRQLEFDKFAEIAREVGAVLAADIAHISGLVAAGAHPSPVGIADVVTSTTHKTLRGPRGGMIMAKAEHATKIDRAVFPGLQGGPHNHTTAAIAVAAKEASTPEFRTYAEQIVKNAKVLAEGLLTKGFSLVTGGTDNHLLLVDLTSKNITGKIAARALDRAGLVLNYNSVPFDPRKPFDPSGIRLGTAAVTSRGFKEDEMSKIAGWMDTVIANADDDKTLDRVRAEVKGLCEAHPAPGVSVS